MCHRHLLFKHLWIMSIVVGNYRTHPEQTPEAAVGEKTPALTVSQLRRLLEAVLPLRMLTLADVLELVAWIQRRNHGTYLSHRKRRETEG
jgi:hypothetical protein